MFFDRLFCITIMYSVHMGKHINKNFWKHIITEFIQEQANCIEVQLFKRHDIEVSIKGLNTVHTLKQYLRVVAPLRGQTTSLMVTCNKPHKKPSSQTISRWLVETIKLAYEAVKLPLEHVTGHSTRASATSWAEFKGVSLEDIMKMADWATAGTYFNHYRQNILSDASISVLSCRSEAR